MSRPPRISVLLPVFNGERFLAEALESVLQQTERRFELIVVDDGSSDSTPMILRQYASCDGRVRPTRLERNEGIVAALNHGLGLVSSLYVARMDADDLCHPQRLELQADYLDAHPEMGLVACHTDYGGDADVHGGFAAFVAWTNSLLTPEQIARNRFVESPLIHPTVAFRHELVDKYGGYRNGAFPEDYEIWLRWLGAGVPMAKIDRALLTWRERPDRLSRQDPRYSTDAFYQIKTRYLQEYLATNLVGKPLIVWGAGKLSRRRAELLTEGEQPLEISSYVDIDPRKIGNTIQGRGVLAPDQLPQPGQCFVLSYVSNRGARAEIEAWFEERGYRAGVDYLLAG